MRFPAGYLEMSKSTFFRISVYRLSIFCTTGASKDVCSIFTITFFAWAALRVLADPTAFGMSRGWYTAYFFSKTAFVMSRGARANDIFEHLIDFSPDLIPNVAFWPGPRMIYALFLYPKTAFGMSRGARANDIFEHLVELSPNLI